MRGSSVATNNSSNGISRGMKIGYGVGDFAFNLAYQKTALFLIYFFTDVFGISAAVAEMAGNEKVIPRIPLIPGFNDDMRSVDALIRFLEDVKYAGPVHFMPHNKMARTKYEKIGKASLYRDMGEVHETAVQSILAKVNASSLHAVYSL